MFKLFINWVGVGLILIGCGLVLKISNYFKVCKFVYMIVRYFFFIRYVLLKEI